MNLFHAPKTRKGLSSNFAAYLTAILILLSFFPSYVGAQGPVGTPQIVTAVFEGGTCGVHNWPFTIEVWNVGSEGGADYAQADWSGYDCINGEFGTTLKHIYGTFTGGPNGTITFPNWSDCQFVDGKTITCVNMEGFLVVQNPEAFDAFQTAAITSEYIYTTYGIRVQDSFGDDEYAQAAWSDHELSLLNDVLKELPPDMLKKMALTNIIRNRVKIDKNGDPKPSVLGTYYSCGPKGDDCSGASSTIRIYDFATHPFDFADDPDGDKEFKGTILHEMIHAMQYKKDDFSIYSNSYDSPLMQNYMDATRPDTTKEADAIDSGYDHNGWGWYGNSGWQLFHDQDVPPTNYAYKNPQEDMSESVMIYVYDPQKLLASSPQRYNFIRDQIFGGIEYENGVQKKP